MRAACPRGDNVFLDNVGGGIYNDVHASISIKSRVVVCGGISRYQEAVLQTGPANYFNLVFQRARMEGFLVTDYLSEFEMAR